MKRTLFWQVLYLRNQIKTKIKNINNCTEIVELIARITSTGTTITAISINTTFIWSAGRVCAFINVDTLIICFIEYFSESTTIHLKRAVIHEIINTRTDAITFERALNISTLKSWTTVMSIQSTFVYVFARITYEFNTN